MFHKLPPRASWWKKIIYLIATSFLGILLSTIAHALIELRYLSWAHDHGFTVVFHGGCALPPLLQAGLLLTGLIGGFSLGQYWWRKVYIERAWFKR